MNNEQLIITASQVEEEDRMEFLPAFFGESLMLKGEGLVYNWMGSSQKTENKAR